MKIISSFSKLNILNENPRYFKVRALKKHLLLN